MVVEWIGRKSDWDLMWRFEQHEMGAITTQRDAPGYYKLVYISLHLPLTSSIYIYMGLSYII